jgi:hypothetical protein
MYMAAAAGQACKTQWNMIACVAVAEGLYNAQGLFKPSSSIEPDASYNSCALYGYIAHSVGHRITTMLLMDTPTSKCQATALAAALCPPTPGG